MVDLSLLMPEFADKLKEFVIEAQYQGLDVDVESGYRSSAEQDKLYALGRTVKNPDGINTQRPMGQIVTNAKGGQSYHNFGIAADVVFRKNGTWDWNASSSSYLQLAKIAKQFGLDWGGSWTGAGAALGDLDHFEMKNGVTLAQARACATIQEVWDLVRQNA